MNRHTPQPNNEDTLRQELIEEFLTVEEEITSLPPLSSVEKVQFDHDIAISHLYYSSKIEGTHLDDKRLDDAIHA